ncbi:MAG: MFS transporter [bacterium]|nr:MFS transporter [Gammaproteobacteria bacterium]HIL97595.1 MFS transporter [Pseudomonadales bacterium]
MRPIYYGYWLIVAAFVAQFIAAGVQNYVIGPFMTPMTEELGWTRAEFTLPRTIGQLVMAFTAFYVGTYVDKLGARSFMLWGTVILAFALYLLAEVSSLWHWVLLNGVILTLGAALVGNLVVNVTLAKWFVEFRGRAVAFAAMGVSFAGVLLTPFATWAIDAFGWRTAWQLLALASFVCVIPAALFMRRAPEDYGLQPDGRSLADVQSGLTQKAVDDFENSMTRREALRSSTFYWLVLAFAFFLITIQVMLLQTVPFMTDAGYDRTTAALMITVASIPALLSKPVWGWLIDGLQPKPLASVSAAITGGSLFIIVFATQAHFMPGLILGFSLLGLGWGGMIPLQEVIWASFFGRRYLGAVRSAAMPFTIFLTAGAPIATSYYFDVVGNYDGAILLVGAANLLSAIMILTLREPVRPGKSPSDT